MLSEQDLYKIKEIISNSQEIDAESKNDLLDKFNKSNLNGYGLNFIRSTEDVEKKTYPYNKDKFIFLNEDTEKEIFKGEDLTNNILFEGDNLESLKVLNSTHNGKIDIIYIDPPYNTGNKDFVYNDSFISNDDGFKHSKWLSFMEKRLKLAYNLLSKEGVIFISIDDNEQANLKLLCDKIFGEHNFISNMSWVKGGGKSDSKYISSHTEYILVYRKSNEVVFSKQKSNIEPYKFTDDRGRYQLRSFAMKGLNYSKSLDYPIQAPDGSFIYAGASKELWEERAKGNYSKKDWCWTLSKKEFENRKNEGRIVFKKSKNQYKVYYKSYYDGKEHPYSSLIQGLQNNSSELKNMFDGKIVFNYAKPKDLIKYLVNLSINKNATVLDFFAGSGTTGHAILELNKEDGGNRQFILCTNNENNICEEVTYQRLSKVINGYTTPKGKVVEGILANLNYFKVDYIDTNEVYDFSDVDAIPYIELKEGVRYNFIDDFEYCSSKNKYVFLVVIEDDMLKVQEFLQNNDEKEVVIYCNSQSIKNKYFNTEFYPLFKSIDKDTILNISKDN